MPEARKACSTIAVTEPFPLVPVINIDWKAFSGEFSAAQSVRMLSRPNLIPSFSRRKSESRRFRLQPSDLRLIQLRGELVGWLRLNDRRAAQETQSPGEGLFQFTTIDDQIEHTVLE